ncbi:sigma-54-dependent Fis family transcriptional regulator [Bacillaceae bacterium Marseille-Q3522]|nr:sigma-54-dependent Fis family transcriptional regulator [Bacillaceae bacterium Marseille-Q3522]
MYTDTLTKQLWNRFIKEGVLDTERIDQRIRESWHRCRNSGVDPYAKKGEKLLQMKELTERQKAENQLLDISLPFLERLRKWYQNLDLAILLIDRDGYVLKMIGNNVSWNLAKQINFVEGARWTECEVGTNAIGTALLTREPMTIIGAEHYSLASQNWSCSASPIHDEAGNIVGIIDVSSPLDCHHHPHLLGTVAATAYAIEHHLQKKILEEEVELMGYALDHQMDQDPYVLCNRKQQIIYIHPSLKSVVHSERKTVHEILDNGARDNFLKKEAIQSEKSGETIGWKIHVAELEKNSHPTLYSVWPRFIFSGVKGTSTAFQAVLKEAAKVRKSDVAVHLYGASGTGKEVIARSIHENSVRRDAPFVAVNCGAIPSDLLESELFGYEAGAFTGANRYGYPGKLRLAHKGTIFLDEIGEISEKMQIALLRVLQEKQVVPIGGTKPVPIDVRIVSATHKDIRKMVKTGDFREDLYYRMIVYTIKLPTLVEREDDITDFIAYYQKKRQWNVHWTEPNLALLKEYHWPGNIRELFNVLELMQTYYGETLPDAASVRSFLYDRVFSFPKKATKTADLNYREQLERERLKKMLEQTDGDAAEAAKMLNIPRSTFYRKLKKYQL